MRFMRRVYGDTQRQVREFLRMFELSEVQEYKAHQRRNGKRGLSGVRRKDIAQAREEQDVFLFVREIPGVQVFCMGYAGKRKMPEVRRDYAAQKRQGLCVLLRQNLRLSGKTGDAGEGQAGNGKRINLNLYLIKEQLIWKLQ